MGATDDRIAEIETRLSAADEGHPEELLKHAHEDIAELIEITQELITHIRVQSKVIVKVENRNFQLSEMVKALMQDPKDVRNDIHT